MDDSISPRRFAFGPAEKPLTALLGQIESDAPATPSSQESINESRDVAGVLRGFILTDILALLLSLVCAWTLSAVIHSFFHTRTVLEQSTARTLLQIAQPVLISACLVLWFEHTGHYHVRMPFWMETKKLVEGAAFAMLINVFFEFASMQEPSRIWLMSNWVFAAFGMILFRSLWRHVLRNKGQWKVRTLLVGSGTTAQESLIALESEPGLGYEIVTQISDLAQAFEQAGFSWQSLCSMSGVDHVLIALNDHDILKTEQALAQLMREPVSFSVSPPLHSLPVLGMMPQYFLNHNVMILTHKHGLDQPIPRFFKRLFDVVGALCLLIIFSPVLLAVALLVKLDGGPVVYGHKRLGLNGRAFPCLKFRSMVTNGDVVLKHYLADNPQAREEWQRDHKLRSDPRVTFIGGFLRRTSLDELPQLINVLKGEMSLVGPRPIIRAEVKKYNDDIAHYYRVRPGITGLWQVSGRNNISFPKRVQMDSWYVRNWSFWHDIAIICKTVPVVINGYGAY